MNSKRNYTDSPFHAEPSSAYQLRAIDLSRDSATCARYRIDSFKASFGSAERLLGADGKGVERYLTWLSGNLSARPGSCCHLCHKEEIVGQLEVGVRHIPDECGWIFLVYVDSAWRMRGLGRLLLVSGEEFLRVSGLRRARLRVGPINQVAIGLYKGRDWKFLSMTPDEDGYLVMQKEL